MLPLKPFYTDETILIDYTSLELPSGLQADATCSVEFDIRCEGPTDSSFTKTVPVVMSGAMATASITIPPNSLKGATHNWRTMLIDSSHNRLAIDCGVVEVRAF